jgi:hypothetical protein
VSLPKEAEIPAKCGGFQLDFQTNRSCGSSKFPQRLRAAFIGRADKQENLLANHLIINPDNMLIADTITTAHHINRFYSKK